MEEITGMIFYMVGSKELTNYWKEGRRGTQHPQLPHSLTQYLPSGVVREKSDRTVKNVSNQQHTLLQ